MPCGWRPVQVQEQEHKPLDFVLLELPGAAVFFMRRGAPGRRGTEPQQPSRAAERSDRSSSLSAPTRASTHSLAYISPRGSVCYMDHPRMHKYTTYMLTSPPVRSAEQQTVVRVLWDLL